MFCKAKRRENFSIYKSIWNEAPWKGIPSNRLKNHMGQKPAHFPKTEVKVVYDNESLIKIDHSLPQIVEPEIEKPITWSVAYRIPIALLRKYCPVITPALHAEWRVNFYKCADDTSLFCSRTICETGKISKNDMSLLPKKTTMECGWLNEQVLRPGIEKKRSQHYILYNILTKYG